MPTSVDGKEIAEQAEETRWENEGGSALTSDLNCKSESCRSTDRYCRDQIENDATDEALRTAQVAHFLPQPFHLPD